MSASIVVRARGSREPAQSRAIRHVVASAVNGLKPQRVSIVDEGGRLLADGASSDNESTAGDERRSAFEKRMRNEVEGIVSSVVGQGRRFFFVMALGCNPGGAQLAAGIDESLAPLSKVLVEYRLTLGSLHIGADPVAEPATRPPLAQQRAQAVARFLVKAGVAGKRIVIAGSGVNRPPVTSVGLENRTRLELHNEPIVRVSAVERVPLMPHCHSNR